MPVVAGGSYFAEFVTCNPSTGAAQNADSLPTATATHNGADDGTFTLTVTNLDAGRYKVTGTVPAGYAAGDQVQVSVAATVATIAGKGVIDNFTIFPANWNSLAINANGAVSSDLQTIKTQSVTCSAGVTVNVNVGTTQPVNFTGTAGSALVKSDMVDIAGAAVSTTTAQLGVNVVQVNAVATTSVTTVNANIGTTQPVNFTGTAASALVQSDTRDFLGHAVVLDANNYPGVNLADIAGSAVSTTTAQLGVNVAGYATGQDPIAKLAIHSGTAQAGTSTTITLDAGAGATNGAYVGLLAYLTGGTGAGQVRTITAYNGTTKAATVDRAFSLSPNATTTFALMPADNPTLNASLQVSASVASVIIRSGTAQAGTSNTITLDAGASATSQIYTGDIVVLTGGTGLGQTRNIISYNGSTKVATVSPAWVTIPNNTSAFQVQASLTPSQFSDQGVAVAGGASTITLDSGASSTDSIYVGSLVTILSGTGAGQTGEITAYVGTTKVATVSAPWVTPPDSTSAYAVIPATASTGGTNTNVNVIQWAGTGVTLDALGLPIVDAGAINAVSTSSVTAVDANVGTTQPVNFTGTGGSALVNATATVSGTVSANVTEWGGTAVAGAIPPDVVFLRSGTAQAGSATTITLDAGASATNDTYQDQIVFLRGGTGAGQSAIISAYDGTTKVATIVGTWATNPDATSVFSLLPLGSVPATVTGGVNVTEWNGSAVAAPNVAGVPLVDLGYTRGTASAGAAGSVGIDWAQVANKTSTVALSNTTISTAQTVTIAGPFKINAASGFGFRLVSSTDHITPVLGATVTGQVSIAGAAYVAVGGRFAEIGNGNYFFSGAAADFNGTTVLFYFTATGADPVTISINTTP